MRRVRLEKAVPPSIRRTRIQASRDARDLAVARFGGLVTRASVSLTMDGTAGPGSPAAQASLNR